nr:MAG TPA: hypothetical protein [Caudoviricetes sp.]
MSSYGLIFYDILSYFIISVLFLFYTLCEVKRL